ncbi:MAG: asparagine synthase (glutamine-hydrolyzing) [Acidobacteriota bacterium]
MCGIAGILDRRGDAVPQPAELAAMIAAVRHRGPDGFGLRRDGACGLAHARLSIIDLSTGDQPMCNEDGSVWISFNGEIFNYLELTPVLEALGHRFRTKSDTETVVHAYEQWGDACVERLNGFFAFAMWDSKRQRLLIARDRLGIRPLFWTERGGRLYFGSELKCLLAAGVPAQFDAQGIDQSFTLWTTVAPRTVLDGVHELPPGHLLIVEPGRAPRAVRYWDVPEPASRETQIRNLSAASEELRALLEDSIKLRLRADVPVGAYLSGGLDSTAAVAITRAVTAASLETYSVAFADKDYDERVEQQVAVRALGTRHHQIEVDYAQIAGAFPSVVALAEKPLMRTAPVPLYLLAGLVRKSGIKVVLTGEGADEVFGGYDIFKETKIRAWWSRRPESRLRPALLRGLYPFAVGSQDRAGAFFEAFFREGIDDVEDLGFSHRPTWRNGARNRAFYGEMLRGALQGYDPTEEVLSEFSAALTGRSPLARAEYLEFKIFLAGHLLASQGDRMSLGHGVEGRYPFLDYRVVEFGQRLAPSLKMLGLQEKHLLRRAVADVVPPEVLWRRKRPYTAPNVRSFCSGFGRDLAIELLSREAVAKHGLFDPVRAETIRDKALASGALGERENMAFIGMLSAQVLAHTWSRPAATSDYDPELFPERNVGGTTVSAT